MIQEAGLTAGLFSILLLNVLLSFNAESTQDTIVVDRLQKLLAVFWEVSLAIEMLETGLLVALNQARRGAPQASIGPLKRNLFPTRKRDFYSLHNYRLTE